VGGDLDEPLGVAGVDQELRREHVGGDAAADRQSGQLDQLVAA